MDVTVSAATRVRRVLLLALFASLAWCVLSLFSSTSSASAADRNGGSGIFGAVGSAVDEVGTALADTTHAVDEVLTRTVQSAAPAIEPVVAPIPAPVAQPVATVVETVTGAADATVGQVDLLLGDVVDGATGTLAEVVDADIVTEIVTPVTEAVTEVPVLGTIVSELGVDDALVGVADAVDGTVSTVVGGAPPTGSVLPELPLGAIDPVLDVIEAPAFGILPTPLLPTPAPVSVHAPYQPVGALAPAAGAATTGPASTSGAPTSSPGKDRASAPGSATHPLAGGPSTIPATYRVAPAGDPGVPSSAPAGLAAGGQSSVAGASGASGAAAATLPGVSIHATSGLALFRTHTDDALPGAPVFDTDVAPD